MKSFKRYLMEKNMYIIGTSKKPQDTNEILGIVDDSDFETLSNIKGEINSNITEAKLVNLLNKKYYSEDVKNDLLRIFKKYFTEPEMLMVLEDLLENKNVYQVKMSNKINKDSIQNIAGYYNSKYKIPVTFFTELANTSSKDKTGTAIGKGEFVLGLFTQFSNAIMAGDLMTDKKEPIEVKGPRGRFRGQFRTKTFSELINSILTVLNESKTKINTKEFHNEVMEFEKNISKTKSFSNVHFNLLGQILVTLDKNKMTKELEQIFKAFFLINNYKYSIKKTDITEMINAYKNGANSIRAFLLAMHLFPYKEKEKFDKLILMKKGYNDFVVLNLVGINTITNLSQLLNELQLELAGWADSVREAAFGITIK